MILKTLSRKTKSYRQLLNYILKPHEDKSKEEQRRYVFKHNMTGQDKREWLRQFRENEKYRNIERRNSIRLFHDIISWHKRDADKLTEEVLREFMHEYARTRCIRPMYVAARHDDQDHVHIHVALSGLQFRTGRAASLRIPQYKQMVRNLQEFQQKQHPEITHSTVDFEKKKDLQTPSNDEYMVKHRTGKLTKKELLIETLNQLHSQSHDLTQFLHLLRENNIEPYYRSDRLAGVWSASKRKYRFRKLGFDDERLYDFTPSQSIERPAPTERTKPQETPLSFEIEREAQLQELEEVRSEPMEPEQTVAAPEPVDEPTVSDTSPSTDETRDEVSAQEPPASDNRPTHRSTLLDGLSSTRRRNNTTEQEHER